MSSKISAARIAASRANGAKSKGPRTAEGKSRVSTNALKHGLCSARNPLELADDATIPIERDEFLTTLATYKDDLHPHGPIETTLVERLAQIQLRLTRALRMETAHFDVSTVIVRDEISRDRVALPQDASQRTRDNWLLMLAFAKDPAQLNLIGRYESRLSRDFHRTLAELRRTQKLRNQTQRHAAAALGVDSHGQTVHSCQTNPTEQQSAVTSITSPESTYAPHLEAATPGASQPGSICTPANNPPTSLNRARRPNVKFD